MPGLNRGVAPLVRQGDSAGDGLAALGGEAFGVHGLPWIGVSTGTDRTRVEPIPLNLCHVIYSTLTAVAASRNYPTK
ncbi:hypothetical protein Van01_18010 [Micromonospora andamanensis]|uniref:Uncharacterized protein n=1 Tax=Micromonospora andamanensis TaxID=1287068 RepID=A0ABQ4HSJ6_9ACTN|nr:hypothetical protein Van01_18010 [Micromonospora andamanensis]